MSDRSAHNPGGAPTSRWEPLIVALCLLSALLSVAGFYDVGRRYFDYRFEYGVGVQDIPPVELFFYVWYWVFGTAAVALFARGLFPSLFPGMARALFAATRRRQRLALALASGLLLAEILAFQQFVLCGAPIADDEATYAFIAQTLLRGRVVNPSPGFVPFFQNQFVILNDAVWYGKYPIGHPFMLALGEVLGQRHLVVPLITAASLLLTFAVGRRVFPRTDALLGTLLLLISPQFVLTGATELSQPTGMLFMLLGLWSLLRLEDDGRRRWAALSGAFWGFGVLVRPFPGVLFLAVAAVYLLLSLGAIPPRRRLAVLALGALPLAVAAGVFLAVNQAQTGYAMQTGYDQFHGGTGLFAAGPGLLGASVGGALLRQNVWLFGWPLSFLFLPLARPSRRAALLWAMVAAEYAYRLIAPKTVVGTTGPIYVSEIVPLLALATGSGLVHLKERLEGWHVERAADSVAALGIALTLVAALMFMPVQLREIRRSGTAWQTANWMLDEVRDGKALVFAKLMVDQEQANSWAYLPPNPSPDLDDEVVFVRRPYARDAEAGIELWQRLFPDRRAWIFEFVHHVPVLREVRSAEDFARRAGDPPG